MKKVLSIVLVTIMFLSIFPVKPIDVQAALYENTYVNTGNHRSDIIGVAKTQIGYREGSNNDTKYGTWYGLPNQPWCAMFVSWCARKAGIPTSILKNSAIAAPDKSYFNIPYYNGASYTPKPGDLFFTKSFSHVGLVYYVDGNYFYTIEGNSNNSGSSEGVGVFSLRRKTSDFYFGVPNYKEENILKVYFNANGGSINSDTYKLSNNLIYNKNDGSKKYQSWVYNNKKANGLMNYSTFGLYKTGYTFAGWGTKASGGTIFDQDDASLLPTDINANVANGNCSTTLYAIWEPNVLNVYFNANGGSVSSDTYKLSNNIIYNKSDNSKKYQPWVYNNKKTNGLANCTTFGLYKTGYTFVGWGTSTSGETVFDQNDASLLPTDINANVANGNCSTTLYAIWEPNELKVYYNANGGSINSEEFILSSSVLCNKSDSSKRYQSWVYNNPKEKGLYNYSACGLYKAGYTFVGWGTTPDGGTIFSQSDSEILPTDINSNIKKGDCSTTLYAIWVPNKLSVYYNGNGGSIDSDTYKLSSNIVCNISDGAKVAQLWTYNNKKSAGLYNNSSMGLHRTGYKFIGWGTSASGETIFDQNDVDLLPTTINSNLKNGDCSTTLYSIWEPNELKVYYNANGGSIDSDTYKLSSNIVCNISDGAKVAQLWTYNNKKSAGLYNNNSMGLYRDGYTFVGWGTTSAGGTVFDQNDVDLLPATINSNLINGDCSTTLYAIWKPNTLNVYFNANGAQINSDTYKLSSDIVCNISDGSELLQTWVYNNPKTKGLMNHNNTMGLFKTGYTFVGWGTTPGGGTIFSQSDSEMLPTDINSNIKTGNCSTTLYAIWVPNTLNVYFNGNGGSVVSETYKLSNDIICNIDGSEFAQVWTYNNKKTYGLPSCGGFGLSRSGYKFMGWGTTSAGGTIFDQTDVDLLPVTINSNLKNGDCSTTLYAIWLSEDDLHSYTIEEIITEPTCTTPGLKKLSCSEHSDCGMYKGYEIPATGHTYGDWDTVVYPTCSEEGSKTQKCACGDTVTESIDILEHNYSEEWIVDVEPTCTTDGSKSYHCNNTDCSEKTEVTVIPATGHTYGEWEVVSHPTCSVEGSKIQKCVCGDTITESIETLEHNFSEEWTVDFAPTCTTNGSKSHHCIIEDCLEKTDITVISATGHSYDDWVVDLNPSCVEEGSKYKNCSACGEVLTETIEKIDHNYSTEWTIDKEVSCTEDGSKSHHCLVCGNKEDVIVISATGHNYVFDNALNVHPHTITYMCTCCDDKNIETPIYNTCVECNFTVTLIDSTEYKLVSYIGTETDVVIPSYHEGVAVTTIANSCFKGNTEITSVEIEEGVTTIGSLVFMNCSSLEKVTIPTSVTSIGTQAFYGFTGTIYCYRDSVAHEYAVANNIDYVLISIIETEQTQIDYDNFVIYTTVQTCGDIAEILGVTDTTIAIPTASYVYGNLELYGTGTVITVFDGNEYIGDFTLVVEGDVNGDSVCDVLDAMHVALVSNGHRTLDGAYAMAADSNSDDMVDVTDYQSIVNKAVS